jgi:hydroxymethylbilane synthase
MPPSLPESSGVLRIGTRASRLARWQSDWTAERLRELEIGLVVEIVEIKTHGDRDRNSPLSAIGGAGVFTKEIQRALMEGAVDVAVHSLKDLPTSGPAGLVLGAAPEREATADVLIAPRARTLAGLPPGAKVGTSSLRRRAMLRHARPDLEVVDIRGNVETRLEKAVSGALDAVVLAEAGLRRLGLDAHATERLGPPDFLPAVGQGALGIECRADDAATLARLAGLDHAPTHRAVAAERRLLAELEGGCMIPLAALARVVEPAEPGSGAATMRLDAAVYSADGAEKIEAWGEGPADDPDALGRRVAALSRERGAGRVLGRG